MEKERLQLCINRYDHYYDTINSKSNVLLSLGIFIVGGLVAAYPSLMANVNCNGWLHTIMGILIALGVANLLVLTWTSLPFLDRSGNSLLYFAAVANMPLSDFVKRSSANLEEDELADLRQQVHALARGLRIKFSRLRMAGYLLIAQIIFFIPLIAYIINHLKQ